MHPCARWGAGTALLVTAELMVGGVAQVVSAWLDGHVTATRDEVVEICAAAFVAIGEGAGAFGPEPVEPG